MTHTISLVVGDWSDDGHGQTDRFTIECNLDQKELQEAYQEGVKKCGIDLTEEVCADYQDHKIEENVIKTLMGFGLLLSDFREDWEKFAEGSIEISGSGVNFMKLWMFIAGLGNSDLRYRVMEDDAPTINIGGYGLFD